MNVVFGGVHSLSQWTSWEMRARTLIFWYINFKDGVIHFSRSVWSLDRAFHRHDLKHCRITATLECVRAGISYIIYNTHIIFIPAPRAAREVSLDASRLWNFIRVVITISWETRGRGQVKITRTYGNNRKRRRRTIKGGNVCFISWMLAAWVHYGLVHSRRARSHTNTITPITWPLLLSSYSHIRQNGPANLSGFAYSIGCAVLQK